MGTWWIILIIIVLVCLNAMGAYLMRNAAVEKGYGSNISKGVYSSDDLIYYMITMYLEEIES